MCQLGTEASHNLTLKVSFVFCKEDVVGYLETQHTQFQLYYRQASVLTHTKVMSDFSFYILLKIQTLNIGLLSESRDSWQGRFKPRFRPMLNKFPSFNLKDRLTKKLDWKNSPPLSLQLVLLKHILHELKHFSEWSPWCLEFKFYRWAKKSKSDPCMKLHQCKKIMLI